MPTPPDRKLLISDVMVVVAVVALSFGSSRSFVSLIYRDMPPYRWWIAAFQGFTEAVACCTLGMIPLRLTRPRPRRSRLWRQPGWLAAVAFAIALIVLLSQQLLNVGQAMALGYESPPAETSREVFLETSLRLPYHASIAVAVAWVVLAMSRRSSPERSWIDRTGRACGWFWITFPILSWLVSFRW